MGAKKVLKEAAVLKKRDALLFLVDESRMSVANYFFEAAAKLQLENSLVLEIPKTFRPLKRVPDFLADCIRKANTVIYLIDRMPEDSHLVFGPMWDVARRSQTKYLTLHDPKPEYLERGAVMADYDVVESKGSKIAKILQNSVKVEVKSDLGTSFKFSLDPTSKATYRGPSYKYKNSLDTGVVQVPEGEGGRKPLQRTASGKIVIDGAITGLGIPPKPVTITFKNGKNVSVEGDSNFLDAMMNYIRRQGERPKSLTGMDTITEFSIGFNDWAILDNNISNCEKVSGGIHFGLGNSKGEWFDNILTNPTLTFENSKGKQTKLIDNGQLKI